MADRTEARIAEIEASCRAYGVETADEVRWLITELRAAKGVPVELLKAVSSHLHAILRGDTEEAQECGETVTFIDQIIAARTPGAHE